jgi:hypothetical protein
MCILRGKIIKNSSGGKKKKGKRKRTKKKMGHNLVGKKQQKMCNFL